jgi:outer membrane protein
MKKIITLSLTLISLGFIAFANDKPLNTPIIAVLNLDEVRQTSSAMKSIVEQLEKKRSEYEAQLEKKDMSLKKQDEELNKLKSVLSEKAMEEKVKEFQGKVSEVQRDLQNKSTILANAQEVAEAEVNKVVDSIVKKMANDKKFTILMPSASMIYFEPNLDITKEIVAKLNDNLKKVTLKFENVSKPSPASK